MNVKRIIPKSPHHKEIFFSTLVLCLYEIMNVD